MSEKLIVSNAEYKNWLKDLKLRIRSVQLKAAISVNRELLQFYWELGAEIVQKQTNTKWGDGFLKQLSTDLTAEFPEMKGFSITNLQYIRKWHLFYFQNYTIQQQPVVEFSQQPVSQITSIPRVHKIAIVSSGVEK